MTKSKRNTQAQVQESFGIQDDDTEDAHEVHANTTEQTREEMRAEIRKEVLKEIEESRNLPPHMTENVHVSREQDSRDAFDFDAVAAEEEGPLPDIPAREGFVQRWVRVSVKDKDDARNLSIRARKGWLPRQTNTVDQGYQYMLSNHQGLGGIIGTHDLVLMERPVEIHRKFEELERKKRENLELAVKSNLFREHKSLGGTDTGFNAPVDESKARVIRGGPPRIAED